MSDAQYVESGTILSSGQWLVLDSPHYEHPIECILKDINDDILALDVSDMPRDEYVSAPLFDSKITIYATNKSGHFEARVKFRSSAPLPETVFYIERPPVMERSQLREFVRVSEPLPVRYKTRNIYQGFNDTKESCLVNISGNGLCFVAQQEIPCPSKIALQIFDLPEMNILTTNADVIRCRPVPIPGGKIYHVGVFFGDYISNPDHTRLLRSLATLQRQHLSKGIRE